MEAERLKFNDEEELQISERVTCQQLFGIQCYMFHSFEWTTGFAPVFFYFFVSTVSFPRRILTRLQGYKVSMLLQM